MASLGTARQGKARPGTARRVNLCGLRIRDHAGKDNMPDTKEWKNMRIWKSTQDNLERLKALLTLRGKQEPGVSIVDRLVKEELQRIEAEEAKRTPQQ